MDAAPANGIEINHSKLSLDEPTEPPNGISKAAEIDALAVDVDEVLSSGTTVAAMRAKPSVLIEAPVSPVRYVAVDRVPVVLETPLEVPRTVWDGAVSRPLAVLVEAEPLSGTNVGARRDKESALIEEAVASGTCVVTVIAAVLEDVPAAAMVIWCPEEICKLSLLVEMGPLRVMTVRAVRASDPVLVEELVPSRTVVGAVRAKVFVLAEELVASGTVTGTTSAKTSVLVPLEDCSATEVEAVTASDPVLVEELVAKGTMVGTARASASVLVPPEDCSGIEVEAVTASEEVLTEVLVASGIAERAVNTRPSALVLDEP